MYIRAMIAPALPRKHHPLALRLKCRKEWVEGQGTLAEVAAREGIPFQTLVSWYRRENWMPARRRWLEKQLSDKPAPTQPHVERSIPQNTDDTHARTIGRLETQLEALDNMLDNAKSADEWHKLSMARQRLFEQWRILRGIPLPSNARQTRRERPQRHHCLPQPEPEPDGPAPEPKRIMEPSGPGGPVPEPKRKVIAHGVLVKGPGIGVVSDATAGRSSV